MNDHYPSLKDFRLPAYEDIPDVGLYLDQVVKYINGFFTEFEDLQITPSMLTNYVKKKLVPKVKRKTYSRDQISRFFFIAMAKTVLSMDNIRLCLDSWQLSEDDFEKRYSYFREHLLKALSGDEEAIEEPMVRNVTMAIVHKLKLEEYFRSLQV